MLFNSLLVRGGGVQISDALQRHRWDGIQPFATTVLTVEPMSGAVRGSRFETRGALGDITFNARDLFLEADPLAVVTLTFKDLGILTWLSTGETRNQTCWVDSREMRVTVIKGSTVMTTDKEITDLGVLGFCGRFTLLHGAVNRMVLYLGLAPWSKEEHRAKVEAQGTTTSSLNCPTVAIPLFSKAGKMWHGCPISFGPDELPSDVVGLGHLGLMEIVGAGRITFPSSDEYEKELCTLLTKMTCTKNVNVARIVDQYGKPETFMAGPHRSRDLCEWPAYRGPVQTAAPEQEAAGRCILIFTPTI